MKPTATSYGEVLTWNMHKVFVPVDAVENALRNIGIKIRMKKTRPSTYLRRAIEQSMQDGVVRKIGENGTHVSFAVVEERGDMGLLDYSTSLKEAIRLNKHTQDLEFKRDNSLTRMIREAVQKNQGGILSAELGNIMKRVACEHCAGVALRDMGGAYFIPVKYKELLTQVEEALTKVINKGATIKLNRFDVVMNARSAQDIAHVYNDAVMREIIEVRDEVLGYLKDIVRARPATFVKRVRQLKKTLKHLNVYRVTLSSMDFAESGAELEKLISLLEKCRVKCIAARSARRAKGKKFKE